MYITYMYELKDCHVVVIPEDDTNLGYVMVEVIHGIEDAGIKISEEKIRAYSDESEDLILCVDPENNRYVHIGVCELDALVDQFDELDRDQVDRNMEE